MKFQNVPPELRRVAATAVTLDSIRKQEEGNVLYSLVLTPLAMAILTDTLDELIAKLSEYMDARSDDEVKGADAYQEWLKTAG